MARKKKGPAAKPAAAKCFEPYDDMVEYVEVIESVDEVVESGVPGTAEHNRITDNSEARDPSTCCYIRPLSPYTPRQLDSGTHLQRKFHGYKTSLLTI
jgi:hypothetical protein